MCSINCSGGCIECAPEEHETPIGWTQSYGEIGQTLSKEIKDAMIRVNHDCTITIQLHGWAIVLLKDGSFFFEDTSGG